MTQELSPGSVDDGRHDHIKLPNTVSDEYDMASALSIGYAMGVRKLLRDIDPLLDLVWAKPGAENIDGGYWYIVRRNPDVPPTYWKVQNPDGSYADPGPEHVERMKEIDTRSGRGQSWHKHRAEEARRHRKGLRRREEMHREFRERLEERLRYLDDTSVAITPAMKARADGVPVSDGGVVLPEGSEELVLEAVAEPVVEQPGMLDDAIGKAKADSFAPRPVVEGE